MISLQSQLGRVRWRMLGIDSAAGIVWGLAAATAILLAGAWLDLLWEFSPELRVVTLWAAGTCGGLLLCVLIAITVRAARNAAIARRLDRAGGAGGRIFTGWELEQGCYGIHGEKQTLSSAGLATLAVEDAAVAAKQVPLAKAAPARPLGRSLAAMALLGIVVGALKICLPVLASTQWNRFVQPFDDVPPFSLTEFEVSPGDAEVLYGNELEIRATVVGSPAEQVELVLKSGNEQEQPLPMFPESNGVWRAVLAKVIEPTDYFVRAYRARSTQFHVGIIQVPLIEGSRVRVIPPEYANRAPYEGPMPRDGVSGLPGTKVQVFLRSNWPLKGGTIALWGGRSSVATSKQNKPALLPMKPIEPGASEAVGEFSITGDGKFECRVINEAGQTSQQSFSGNVLLLADQRPFIRITEPEKMSLATPSAVVPVRLSAEDDCGISKLQLFRSLNDSRPLPTDLPLPVKPPRRFDESVRLSLAQFKLEPGDVIKLFGRVEDNDPAGVKGAESSIVVVRIVSEEEFERMIQAQQGIDAMLSKYYAARRRMEGTANELEALRNKLKALSPSDKLAEETRKEIHKLEQMMQKDAEEIRKSAKHLTPFDLDKNMTPQLEELAKMSEEMAKELEKYLQETDLINEKLAGKLEEMAKKLKAGREDFEEQAAKPMEYLEAIYPLMLDQQRFVMIVLWQQDLAERLSAMKGRDGEDNPSLKARMRDLEQEQRQIRDALTKLLDDIQEHSEMVPELPQFEKLIATAQQFVKEVRGSRAIEAQADAEAALAEFLPTNAYGLAKEAAEILARFLKQCKGEGGMGEAADGALAFQPSLCKNLGNTIPQLMSGMNPGMGNGQGSGMMGGYSSVGLYGGMPEMLGGKDGQSGENRMISKRGLGHAGKPKGDNPDETRTGETLVPGAASGASDGAIPARYRRQVGKYFERVAEETGESGP